MLKIFNCIILYRIVFIKIYFNNLKIQNYIWNLFKLFDTALIWASEKGNTEIVKMLVEQDGIDINAKNIYFFLSKFISIILDFKIIIRNSSNYYIQHL